MLKRTLVATATAALVITGVTIAPAHAGKTDLYVVGTSDVQDSGLMDHVIIPGFEAAYPQYALHYTGKSTGAAITAAKTGNFAAIIVHAASQENLFVQQGWSSEPYGRAMAWGDFVVAGPASGDPGNVIGGGAAHDVVKAFENIAAAGANGQAVFVSRADTSGTVTQEHAIWALVPPSALPAGVTLCTPASGGGKYPSKVSPCPDLSVSGTSPTYPDWYEPLNGATQAGSVIATNTCSSYKGSQANSCYVLTDRGTLQFEQSLPADQGGTTGLKAVVRNNDAAAPGGITALINSFHAYVVNPNAPGFAGIPPANLKTDVSGATALLNWITSPAGQAAIGAYQAGDPSFLPSAAPALKATSTVPASVAPGTQVTVTGTLKNVVPGTPALGGVPVRLMGGQVGPGLAPTVIGSATTDGNGGFSITFTAHRSELLSLATDGIQKIERPDLSPPFGDLLQPTTTVLGPVAVNGHLRIGRVKVSGTQVGVWGALAPAPSDGRGMIRVWAKRAGGRLRLVKRVKLKAGASGYHATFKLKKGTWKLTLVYSDGSAIVPGAAVKKVTIR